MKLAIGVLLLLLTSAIALSQSAGPAPEWKIVAQVNGDRVEFKCVEGCLWTLTAVGCADIDQCRWTLDQSGILASADPFDYETELEKGRQEHQRRQQEEAERQKSSESRESMPNPCYVAGALRKRLEIARRKYSEQHPDIARMRDDAESARLACVAHLDSWPKKGAILACDGYMTRYADQDYCSDEIPADWVPFTFDGQQYYFQPLVAAHPK